MENNWWEDVEQGSINKRKYRANFKDEKRKEMSLNGTWDFKFFKDIRFTKHLSEKELLNQKELKTITIPSCWELNGFGKPHYENSKYHVGYLPPKVVGQNPFGIYKKVFYIQKKKNFKYVLRMHGLDSICKIFVNQSFVGLNKNARVTSEFDITSFLKDKENEIQLFVAKYSDTVYLEDQDMFRYGGIFRKVEILEENEDAISDFQVWADFQNGKGVFSIITNSNLENAEIKLVFKNQTIFTQQIKNKQKFTKEIENVNLWNAEEPNLYKLTITNRESKIEQKIGFRNVKIKNNVFYLNDVPIKIKGVNMHDFNPTTGKVVDYQRTLKQLKIMKQNNINAIRTSHYPKDSYFYELTDQLGFYVMDEADLECHGAQYAGNWNDLANKKEYEKHFLERANQMIARDKNHCSILFYSLGNEAGFGNNFKEMAKLIRSFKTNTLLHYEGDFECEIVDISSNMYTWIENTTYFKFPKQRTFKSIENGQRENQVIPKWKQIPHVECEYAHAMGNGPGSLKDYWDYFYQNDNMMGGFIWEWFDHALLVDGKYKYGGDYGEKKHDGNFCVDGLLMPNDKPSPGLIEYKAVLSPVYIKFENNKIFLKNNLDFLKPKDEFILSAQEINDQGQIEKAYNLEIPSIKRHSWKALESFVPKSKSTFLVKLDLFYKNLKPYSTKKSIYTFSFELKKYPTIKFTNELLPKWKWENQNLVIKAKAFEYQVNLYDGQITITKNKELVLQGNQLSFWRPLTDNDKSSVFTNQELKNKYFLNLTRTIVDDIKVKENKNQIIVLVKTQNFNPCQAWGFEIQTKYTFSGQNIKVEIKSKLIKAIETKEKPHWGDGQFLIKPNWKDLLPSFLPRIGFNYKVNKNFKKVNYYGLGPEESYPDSKEAGYKDFFATNINELETKYIFPQENGNRSEVKKIKLFKNDASIAFCFENEISFNYLKNSVEQIDQAKHQEELKKEPFNYLSLNYKQGPLGSHACGPFAMEKYLVKPEDFQVNFVIKLK